MTSSTISKIQKIISLLDGNSFKVYMYLWTLAGDRQDIQNITREKIEKDCQLGYTTVYKALKILKEKGFIEVRGKQHMIKLLPVE